MNSYELYLVQALACALCDLGLTMMGIGHLAKRRWVVACGFACVCAVLAGTPQAEESTNGFYLGAGWPGGGHLQRVNLASGQGADDPLQMQAQDMGTHLAQAHSDDRPSFSSGALQLRAGYDFGAVQGFITLSGEAQQSALLREREVGVGLALPLNPNVQLLGEVQQSQADNSKDSSHVWSVTAAFRF